MGCLSEDGWENPADLVSLGSKSQGILQKHLGKAGVDQITHHGPVVLGSGVVKTSMTDPFAQMPRIPGSIVYF